ncbi:MAG: beta-phosphoglucomutase, partial [Treponema sp.]|nr:beta-phosphoglucomutase [Treponema sp.]
MIQGFIFDLDGVLVDTAKYHYLAWRRLAQSLGFDFTQEDNERLKGVSRMQSLDILLSIGGIQADEEHRRAYAEQKNHWYVEYISAMGRDEILPEADRFVRDARSSGIKTAIASASKNTPLILDRLGITELFDAVIDGNLTSRAKPDPEVFILAAKTLELSPERCVVFEDAAAGVQAARRADM